MEIADDAPVTGGRRFHGDVALSFLATIFKKIKLDTHENVGWGKIHLPQEDLHTSAYWFSLGASAIGDLAGDELQGGLWGMSNLLVNVAPLFLLCDPRDIRTVTQVKSPFTGAPTIFLYDNHPGGIGFSDRLFDAHE